MGTDTPSEDKKGKMLILPGIADTKGTKYPDENGKYRTWPDGALHVGKAKDYARKMRYEPEIVQIEGSQAHYHGPQVKEVLKRFLGLKLTKHGYKVDSSLTADQDIHAFYGFSGGGINVYWILKYLAENTPDELRRIDLVVVIGAPEVPKTDYEWSTYKAIAKKKVHLDIWDAEKWKNGWGKPVYGTNPPRNLLPKTLPPEIRDNVGVHMFGADVLLAGHWPEKT